MMDSTWQLSQLLGPCETIIQQLYTEAEWAFAVIVEGLLLLVMGWLIWRHYAVHRASSVPHGVVILMGIWLYCGYHALKKYRATQDILQHGAVTTGRIRYVYHIPESTEYGAQYSFMYQGDIHYGYILLPAPIAVAGLGRQEAYQTAYMGHSYTVLFSKANPANSYLSTDCPVSSSEDNL